jgi:hypothetical protein
MLVDSEMHQYSNRVDEISILMDLSKALPRSNG